MAHTKERSLAVASKVAVKAQAPRLRRKLQKSVSKYRVDGTRRLGPNAAKEACYTNKCDTANPLPPPPPPAQARGQAQSRLPPLSLPSPDLSGSKWSEFLRDSGCFQGHNLAARGSSESLQSPVNLIPEFSHLAIRDAQPQTSLSSDSQASASVPTMRRRAKTPVFNIGQLENIPRPSNALGKASNVELIAEQYRALLESRASAYSDARSEPPPSRYGVGDDDGAVGLLRRQQSSEELDAATPIHAATHTAQVPGGSPTSDDGTLVAFEEETVYFKPVSFSPEPLSPFLERQPPSPLSPAPDNLSLQICLDLLTRDLASALASRPSRSSPKTSALQIWVMIEAYERLRDQIAETRLGMDELRPLVMMFDMWLRALYTVHDSLTGESDYETELTTEELD